MNEVEGRPCICGALTDIDYHRRVQVVECLCGEVLTIRTRPITDSWHIQHGQSPEHRSPEYPADRNLLAACDWIDAVHDALPYGDDGPREPECWA